jgi:hypothetical protein
MVIGGTALKPPASAPERTAAVRTIAPNFLANDMCDGPTNAAAPFF